MDENPAVLAAQVAATAANIAKDVAQRTSDGLMGLASTLQAHTASDELHFQSINSSLVTMKDNHLFHIEKDMASIVGSVAIVAASVTALHTKLDANTVETTDNKTSVKWLKTIGSGAFTIALIFLGAMVYIVREAVTK